MIKRLQKGFNLLLVALTFCLILVSNQLNLATESVFAQTNPTIAQISTVPLNQLPPEATTTLNLIDKGGPFPYDKDGTVFNNREGRLPAKPRGYYREYTIPTPGQRNRGARRFVIGQNGEIYYTGDHYNSFVRVRRK